MTTVTALAAAAAMRADREVFLVDLCGEMHEFVGDQPGARGLADLEGGSVGEINDLVSSNRRGLSVVHRGRGRLGETVAADLRRWAEGLGPDSGREPIVLVDAGVMAFRGDSASWATRAAVVASSDHSVLVTRPCFLSLQRALELSAGPQWWVRPDSVVLANEPGRALAKGDIERLLGVPVAAQVPVDPAVAAAIDTGALFTGATAGVLDDVGWLLGHKSRSREDPAGPPMEVE